MRYLVQWQFMGPKSVSFDCLIDALEHSHHLIEIGLPNLPLHVSITPIPF